MKGIIFDIKRFSTNDGPGIRTTVFLKGCPLACWWCHNPESRSAGIQEFSVGSSSKTQTIKRIGECWSVDDLLVELEKDRVFFEESGGGITFSGGEPLMQLDFLMALANGCKKRGIHTAIDTCGFTDFGNFDLLLDKIDLFLYDFKQIDEIIHQKYTGVSNNQILENLKFLHSKSVNLVLRVPFIPGINDSENDISNMVLWMNENTPSFKEIHLLPYHSFAKAKYHKYGFENKLAELPEISESNLLEVKRYLMRNGFNVKIGG